MAEITDKIRKVVSTTAIQKNGPGHTSVWSDANDLLWVNVSGTKKKILTTSDETSEVNGPGSSTDNAVARWDSTTGTLIQNSVVVISDTGAVSGVTSITGSGGQVLDVSTADVTTLARSTNLQEFRVGPSGDYLSFQKGTGSGFIQTFGTDNLNFGVNNTQYWRLEGTTGHFGAVTDNVNDIGASGANRPRTLYAGTSVVTPLIGTGGTLNYIGIQKDSTHGVTLDVATANTAWFKNIDGTTDGATVKASKFISTATPALGAATGQVLLLKSDGTFTTDGTTLTYDSSSDLLSVNGLSIHANGVRSGSNVDVSFGTANSGSNVFIKGSTGAVSVNSAGYLFANAPSVSNGYGYAIFTDSNTAVWGATIAGGGSNTVLGFYNGTNWTVAGK